jgi:hypothetical protein
VAEANDAALIRLLSEPEVTVALGAVLAVLGGIGLVFVIAAAVRLIGRSVVARTPVTGEHALDLPGPGGYALHLEGPMFSSMPGGPFVQLPGVHIGGPQLALRDEATGAPVELRAPLLPTRSSGFSRARHEIRTFNVPRTGRYVLASSGVDLARDWSDREFVVTRPYGFKLLFLILTGIASLFALMGGLALLGLAGSRAAGL